MAVDVLTEVPNLNHPYVWDFERQFDPTHHREWMQKNWTCSFPIAIIYVIIIFSIKNVMEKRDPFNLRIMLGIWSSILAIFSILGSIRTVYELSFTLDTYGLQFTVCNPSVYSGITGFWVFLYTWSKLYELGDTVFIVLRKQKLIFLHWYHHLVTLIYMFFAYKDFIALGRWGITMNFCVHSIMYSYYALKAFNIRVPKFVNITITVIQLVQMAIGIYFTTWNYYLLKNGVPCHQTMESNVASFIMYLSYMVLFANFFKSAYMTKSVSKTKQN